MKNVDPYAEPAIVNGASRYSYACSAAKYNPNNTVKNSSWVACVALFSSRPWFALVTVTLRLIGSLYLVMELV